MGLLFNLLTLPVTGPIKGTVWIAEQVLAAAEQEEYDEAAIQTEFADLQARHERGEVSGSAYEQAEDALLARLVEARRRRSM